MKKPTLIDMLKNVFLGNKSNPKSSREVRKNLSEALDDAHKKYQELAQSEKDRLCVELAQDMGCQSNDIATCSRYIYEATYGSAPPKVH